MGEQRRLSTSDVEPKHRLDFWRASLADAYTPCEVTNFAAADFESEMTRVQVGGLAVSRVEGVPQTFKRPQSMIKSGDCDDYVASIRLKIGVDPAIGDRDGEQPRLSIKLCDMGRPFETPNMDRLSGMGVHIPRKTLEHAFGPAFRAAGLVIGRDEAIAPVIRTFFGNLMEHGHLFDPVTADRMSAIGVDLIAAGFAAQLSQQPRTSMGAATLVYRAKVFIDDRLSDETLCAATIAGALNLSVRRLQEVFAEQALTVGDHIRDRRLAEARARLRDPAYAAVSVARIGYGVGFINASHFSRSFRQTFGLTPSEYREAGKAESPV